MIIRERKLTIMVKQFRGSDMPSYYIKHTLLVVTAYE